MSKQALKKRLKELKRRSSLRKEMIQCIETYRDHILKGLKYEEERLADVLLNLISKRINEQFWEDMKKEK